MTRPYFNILLSRYTFFLLVFIALASSPASAVVVREVTLDPAETQVFTEVSTQEGTFVSSYLSGPLSSLTGGTSVPLALDTDFRLTVRLPEGYAFRYDPAYSQFEASLYFENQPPAPSDPIGSLGMRRDALTFRGPNVTDIPFDFRLGHEFYSGATTRAIELGAFWPSSWFLGGGRGPLDGGVLVEPIYVESLEFAFAFIGAFNNPSPHLADGEFRFGGNTFGFVPDHPAVQIVPLPGRGVAGDFDASGSVEQADLNLVLSNWGAPRADWPNAEGLLTSLVDQEELNAVLNAWGASSPQGQIAGPIPEPSLLGPVMLAGCLAIRSKRRTGY
ncbi:MAG: hypothetical protein AAGF84_02620 [Planctomycetota bacterium]